MGFIKLTERGTGTIRRIAIAHISSITEGEEGCYVFAKPVNFITEESPEEILALIKAEEDRELRDGFAMAALPEIIREDEERNHVATMYASSAYEMADAMMRVRK